MTRPVPIAPMMADIVRKGVAAVDGRVYEELDRCPLCGGSVRPHDYRAKRFATIIDGTAVRNVRVHVKRFRCQQCGRLGYARSPFYEGTRHGAPIVELAAVMSERMPPGRTAKTLRRLGIVLDRATIRAYATLPLPPITTMDLFGMPVPLSLIQLHAGGSIPAGLAGVRVTRGLRTVAPAQKRQEREEEEHEEERDAQQVEHRADPE